jgi:hypothetical protein
MTPQLRKRIEAYVTAVPGAISGKRGHDQTFKLACELIHGFSLTKEQARPFICEYNQRCEPQWSAKELEHKLDDAEKTPSTKERGWLLDTTTADRWAEIEGKCAAELLQRIGHVRCVSDSWYVETNGIWLPTDRVLYRPQALDVLSGKWRTHKRSLEVISRLEGEQQVSADRFCGAAKFDENGNVLLAVQNGVLRISPEKAELLPPDASHGFTAALSVPWDINAKMDLFNRVLSESLPDTADRHLLLDVLATALIPDGRYEAALVCQGETGTGKSTIFAPVAKIFDDTCSVLSMVDLCHPSGYKLAKLRHKLINLATELNTIEVDDAGLFKQLVSGEEFTARPIYGKPFKMRSIALLAFLANALPRFKNGSEAEVRRLRFVRFSQKPKQPDFTLKERVAQEAPGVFAELVRRTAELLAGRVLAEPSAYGRNVTRHFAISNDPVGQFVAQHCTLDPKACTIKIGLSTAFEGFREKHAISEKFETRAFFKQLYERFDNIRQARPHIGESRYHVVYGIELKEERRKGSKLVRVWSVWSGWSDQTLFYLLKKKRWWDIYIIGET